MASRYGPYVAYTVDHGNGFQFYGVKDATGAEVLEFDNGQEEPWTSFDIQGQASMVTALSSDDSAYIGRKDAHYFSRHGASLAGSANIPFVISTLRVINGSTSGDNEKIAQCIALLQAQ